VTKSKKSSKADNWLTPFPRIRWYASRAARRRGDSVSRVVRYVAKTFYIQEFEDPGITQRIEDGLTKAKKPARVGSVDEVPVHRNAGSDFAGSSDQNFLRLAIASNLDRPLGRSKTTSLGFVDVKDPSPSVEDEVAQAELQANVEAVIETQPIKDRFLVDLLLSRYAENKSEAAMAREIGIPKQTLNDALKRLIERLSVVLWKYRG
jgi:hypothetical protein